MTDPHDDASADAIDADTPGYGGVGPVPYEVEARIEHFGSVLRAYKAGTITGWPRTVFAILSVALTLAVLVAFISSAAR
ncbi:MAG TPA: hypothetical protein VM618_10660 [Acidimicrobiia bacterium]|nr:hypothetical protein [Acidimicrobiia bacterium]